ncbi:hypothetical protein GE107_10240 [Cohnella sp. CFH 77786]|uniref:hypothetical protein n=1 Tax=Cohnella sp. CFH 77786 TaxID=2662265 RepID=UPI001C610E99|nr:hypothetical protein [Cohnella sp. CFH 77786]MBW5446439.1 hypothetical protein [Cohnella sp. CFH 77786]
MRKSIENFKELLVKENKLAGHEDVLLAFDHLLDLVDEHEEQHRIEVGVRSLNKEKTKGEVEAAIREEDLFFRKAIYTVIERTIADLVNRGNKEWHRFYDRVE